MYLIPSSTRLLSRRPIMVRAASARPHDEREASSHTDAAYDESPRNSMSCTPAAYPIFGAFRDSIDADHSEQSSAHLLSRCVNSR